MGIKKLPSYRDYWSSQFALRDHFISQSLSRDRFIWLLGNLHLNDNAVIPKKGTPQYDKLYKVRPLINTLSETFKKSYRPLRTNL